MTKVTIDTIPPKDVQYLDRLPSQGAEFQGLAERVPSVSIPIQQNVLYSELEKLLGSFIAHQSFAEMCAPPNTNCPGAFADSLISQLNEEVLITLLNHLKALSGRDFDEQEEIEILLAFFESLLDKERLYQLILAHVRRTQKS